MAPRFVLRPVRDGDYGYIIERVDEWWDGRAMAAMLPKLFFEHFNATTMVAADADDRPIGFLAGFVSQSDPAVGYIHFVGVDPAARGLGLGRAMYHEFFDRVAALGCRRVECVTSPINSGSRAFHASLGFREQLVDDYDGPGESRMVLRRDVTPR
jgi:ribosomal protein S18 acetylase RimI-like enzyme